MGTAGCHGRLCRVSPPDCAAGAAALAKNAATNERDPDYAITIAGLVVYVLVVAGVLVLLDIA